MQPKIKINFKIPFSNANLSKKVMSPYFPINPYKEENNGKQIFVSPLLKNRKWSTLQNVIPYIGDHRMQVMSDMKKIMEQQSKSPMNQPRV